MTIGVGVHLVTMLVEVEVVIVVVMVGVTVVTVVAMTTAEIVTEGGHHREEQEGLQVIHDLLHEVLILVVVDIENKKLQWQSEIQKTKQNKHTAF